ncbi:DUF29 family protein [Roseivivax marinus]|nr:DUF29 family protein [Roseivivax marinus]
MDRTAVLHGSPDHHPISSMSDVDPNLYRDDFLAWAIQQAALIRTLDVPSLDAERVAEELEAAGEREIQQCKVQLRQVMMTLIKLSLEPDLAVEDRGAMAEVIVVSVNDVSDTVQPSHLNRLDVDIIWRQALREISVARSVNLPDQCPLHLDWLLSDDFEVEPAIESVRTVVADGGTAE